MIKEKEKSCQGTENEDEQKNDRELHAPLDKNNLWKQIKDEKPMQEEVRATSRSEGEENI